MPLIKLKLNKKIELLKEEIKNKDIAIINLENKINKNKKNNMKEFNGLYTDLNNNVFINNSKQLKNEESKNINRENVSKNIIQINDLKVTRCRKIYIY